MDLSILYFQGSQVKLLFLMYFCLIICYLSNQCRPRWNQPCVAFHLDLHCWPKLKGGIICWYEVRRGEYKNIHFARRWNYEYFHTFKHGSAVAQWSSAWLETEGPRVRASPASLRCGPWARHIYPSLVLVHSRKTVPHNWKIVEWT